MLITIFSRFLILSSFFFFNDTATTEIYTLSLHDALPIYNYGEEIAREVGAPAVFDKQFFGEDFDPDNVRSFKRSEEHTSELQSRQYLVCRLLLEKKKKNTAQLIDAHAGE